MHFSRKYSAQDTYRSRNIYLFDSGGCLSTIIDHLLYELQLISQVLPVQTKLTDPVPLFFSLNYVRG